jgi:IS5 family transposase
MRPKEMKRNPMDDLFRTRLENIIDMRHELVKVSEIIDWSSLRDEFACLYSDVTGRAGKPSLNGWNPSFATHL